MKTSNKYKIGDILIHKNCNLKMKILKYEYDLFGEYVKVLEYKTRFRKQKITKYYIEILREYKLYKNNSST